MWRGDISPVTRNCECQLCQGTRDIKDRSRRGRHRLENTTSKKTGILRAERLRKEKSRQGPQLLLTFDWRSGRTGDYVRYCAGVFVKLWLLMGKTEMIRVVIAWLIEVQYAVWERAEQTAYYPNRNWPVYYCWTMRLWLSPIAGQHEIVGESSSLALSLSQISIGGGSWLSGMW